MTHAVTELAKQIEDTMLDLAKVGASLDRLIGFEMGYRDALRARGLIGDIEDEALGRHFDGWSIPADLKIEP